MLVMTSHVDDSRYDGTAKHRDCGSLDMKIKLNVLTRQTGHFVLDTV